MEVTFAPSCALLIDQRSRHIKHFLISLYKLFVRKSFKHKTALLLIGKAHDFGLSAPAFLMISAYLKLRLTIFPWFAALRKIYVASAARDHELQTPLFAAHE